MAGDRSVLAITVQDEKGQVYLLVSNVSAVA
jgi:hypothetical protein